MKLADLTRRLIDPDAAADGPPPRYFGGFARWALKGSWPAIIGGTTVTGGAALIEVATAWYTGWAIDMASEQGLGAFWETYWPVVLVGALFFLVLRPILFSADAGITSLLIAPHLFNLVLARTNRYTLGHSMRYFENDFAGRIAQKAMQTATALTQIVVELLDVGVYATVMFIGALILIGDLDPWLLAAFAVWGVVYVATLYAFIPEVRRRSKARAGARAVVTGQVVDAITNISTVKLFADEATEDRTTAQSLEELRLRAIDFGVLSVWFRLALTAISGVLPFASIVGALLLWSRGQATAGDIAAVAMVATRLGMVTNRLGRVAVMIYTNVGEVQDGIQTLTPPHDITDRPAAVTPTRADGAVAFEDVTFAYGKGVTALRDFSLFVAPGEKVALVGASGAGKSTVISLLLRLYDVEKGRVTLDGTDIRDLTQTGLRQQISVVRQETSMFNRTARENIRYGRPDATDDDVVAACKVAAAHDFIQDLRDHKGRTGYDAYLGERGVKLSGGQRQRIALARAILKNAPILVLDEATSALDSEVEAEIQAALGEVMEGKTVIAIAHRLSTIARMDRIVVLEDGRIVEQGTHDDLLARDGVYAKYWKRQSGGFVSFAEAAE